MDHSSIGKLSAELRNQIYHAILVNPSGHHLSFVKLSIKPQRISSTNYPHKNRMALTATCKQIRQETLPMVYGANTLRIDFKQDGRGVRVPEYVVYGWLKKIGPGAQLLRHVELSSVYWLPSMYSPKRFVEILKTIRALFKETTADVIFTLEMREHARPRPAQISTGPLELSISGGKLSIDGFEKAVDEGLDKCRRKWTPSNGGMGSAKLREADKYEKKLREVIRLLRKDKVMSKSG